MMEVRTVARLVVLDADQRVLLFRHVDGHGRAFWATPGGGLEPGETAAQLHRAEGIAEVRWWSIDDIRNSVEPIFPLDLANRLKEHLGRSLEYLRGRPT
jgi:8-oxo-dGTP diphosphatase